MVIMLFKSILTSASNSYFHQHFKRWTNDNISLDAVTFYDTNVIKSFETPFKTRVKPQKEPLELFFYKKLCKLQRKTPVLKSLFNRIVVLLACNFIKKRLQPRCFLVEIFAKFLRTPILKNIWERLLLKPVLSLGLPIFITYISGSNCYLCFILYVIIDSFFANSPFSTIDTAYFYNQKQSSGGVLQKRCSYKFRNIHKKTPALESRF